MSQLLTLSRAARLVGVSRGTLQKQIQDGELPSFEGMVDIDDLTRAYPQAELEDNTVIEKIEEIIDNALERARGDKLRKLLAPDLGTLAARVASLSKELARIKSENNRLHQALQITREGLQELAREHAAQGAIGQLLEQLETMLGQPADAENDQLLIQDTVLRIMAAQVHLMPSGHDFFVQGNTSILEAGLNAGLALNYGCSNGNCGKCKARLISGEVKKIRPHDYVISEAEKSQGYILTCSNTAISDIVLQADEALSEDEIPAQLITARVRKIEHLTPDLVLLQLRTPRTDRLRFLAGQRARLTSGGLEPVEYHIASCPCDDMNLQFHICRNPDSPFAEHVFNGMQTSEAVTVEGPHGHFVLREDTTRPLLFIAVNTGFAPIKSLIEHAMTLDANEFSHLYWFHQNPEQPYLHNVGRAWADAFDNFRYTHQHVANPEDHASLSKQLFPIARSYPELERFDIYACGPDAAMRIIQDFFRERNFPSQQLFTESL